MSIIRPIDSPKPYESFTNYSLNKVLEWRYREDQGSLTKAVSIIGSEFASIGLLVIGTIETIARLFFYLIVKGVDWVIDSEGSNEFKAKSKANLFVTGLATSAAGFQIIGSFFDDHPTAQVVRMKIASKHFNENREEAHLRAHVSFPSGNNQIPNVQAVFRALGSDEGGVERPPECAQQ